MLFINMLICSLYCVFKWQYININGVFYNLKKSSYEEIINQLKESGADFLIVDRDIDYICPEFKDKLKESDLELFSTAFENSERKIIIYKVIKWTGLWIQNRRWYTGYTMATKNNFNPAGSLLACTIHTRTCTYPTVSPQSRRFR